MRLKKKLRKLLFLENYEKLLQRKTLVKWAAKMQFRKFGKRKWKVSAFSLQMNEVTNKL